MTDASTALTFEDLREVLELSLFAGQLMLENGANTFRVEETVQRLGAALGAERMDVYVTPTGLIATATCGSEHRSRVVRSYHSGIDLNRTASVLEVTDAASAGELDRAGVRAALEAIATQPRLYRLPLTVLWVAMACACFALLFGGGVPETTATAIAAGAAHLLRAALGKLQLGRIIATFLVAILASFLGLELAVLLQAKTPEVALLAPVLLLVPGVLMVSSVADLFRGDLVSGTARAMSAFMVTVTIGAGIWMTTLLGGTRLAPLGTIAAPLLFAGPLAFIATAGFGVLFDVPRKALMLSALVGSAAYSFRALALAFPQVPAELAMFIGGVACAALAEPLSRWLRLPTSTFIIPGFIPLVPGVAAFRTLLLLVDGNYAEGTAGLVRTTLLIGALAAGIGAVNALRPTRQNGVPVFRPTR